MNFGVANTTLQITGFVKDDIEYVTRRRLDYVDPSAGGLDPDVESV